AAFSGVFSSWQDSFTEFFRDFSRGIADVGDLVAALGDAVLDQVARIAAQSVTASLARTAGAGLGLAGAGAADGGVLEWLGLGADAAGLVGGGGSVGTTAARWLGLTTPALPGVPPGPAGIGGVTPAGALSPFGSHLAAGIDAAPWGIAGSLAASLLGFQGTGNQWADLGLSTLGSVGGGAAGAALLAPALGAAGGPVGAAAGAFLAMVGGDLLSGLFGQPLPNASQSIDIAGGRVVAQAPEGRLLSQEEIAEWGAASQAALVGPIQSLVDTLARAGADASGYAVATSWKDGRQSVGLYGGDFTRGGSGTWTDVESLAEAGVVAVRELALAVAGGDASLADAALVARDSTADTADALARQIALAADWEGTLARTEAQYITAHRQMAEMAAGLAQWEQGARAVLAPMVETRDILAAAGRDTGDLSVGLEHLAETMLGLHDTALSPVQVAVQTATGQIDALGRMLEDLGYSADRTAGYLAALEEAVIGQMRDQFDEANQDRVYELTGMGAIPDLRAIANSYVHAMTDAAALGADTALLTRRALLEVQATVEGMDVAGLSGLIAEIEGMGHEGQAVELVLDGLNAALDGMGDAADGAAGQVSGAADRIAAANRGLERRLLAASVDTGSLEGALALFDWDAAVEMAELSALGADITLLERALAEERLDIIQRFTDDAVAAERRRAEEMARAWDQAASVIAGIATDIRQYLDGVYGGASSPLGTHARMDRAVDDFWAAYARAQTGDRAALSAITRYDATARDAIAAYHASSAPADALYAQMTAALGADTALLTRRALLEVQATVEGMDAAGLSDLIAEIEGMGHEGQAVELVLDGLNAALDGLGDAAGDTAGQVSGAADRIAAAAEQRRADQARQAWEQEAAWIAGQQRSIAQWVSGLFAGASSPLGPDARLAVASEDYLAQLALAESGDRAALQSITQYAQQYVEAGAAAHASGPLAAQIALAVRDDLLALSEALTPEEYIAAEITAAIETQTVDITDATDAAAQLLDSTFRALDANDDGGISWAEFQTWAAQDAGRIDALRSTMGSGFSGYSIRDLYNAIDANGDGTVSQLEWLRAVTGQVEDHTAASAITADLLYDYLRQMHNGLVTSYFVGVADISAAVERVRGAILALPHAAGGPAAGLTLVNEHLVPEIIRLPGGAEVVTAESSAAMIRRMVDAPGLGSVGETLVLPPVAPADGALTDALAGLRAEVRGLSRRLDRLVAGQQAQTDLLDDTAHDQTGHLRRAADGIARQTERLAALEVLRP
ncbi:EF-hand domain-containing protein, partial [Roseospira goensis]